MGEGFWGWGGAVKMSEGLGGWVRTSEVGCRAHRQKGTGLPVEASTVTGLAKVLTAIAAVRSDPKLRGSEPDTGPLTVREISSLT